MKLTKLESLKQLQRLSPLYVKEKLIIPINEIELISYSTNLCLFSMRILRNEITVNNRSETLDNVMKEIVQLNGILTKGYSIEDSKYTKNNIKSFFKSVGLKPKHIKTN